MIAILHNIRSLQNVGSMFRTADAAGITKLFLCGYTPTPLNKYGFPNHQLAKTALGAQDFVDWEKIGSETEYSSENSINLIKELKKKKYKILAIEQAEHSKPYNSLKLTRAQVNKIALIVGPEVEGLPDDIVQAADQVLEIPMQGQKESLNVGVAFGIVAFALSANSR